MIKQEATFSSLQSKQMLEAEHQLKIYLDLLGFLIFFNLGITKRPVFAVCNEETYNTFM